MSGRDASDPPDAIDVYRVRLAGPARSGCADGALRAVLARTLGRSPIVVVDAHGKPQLADSGLELSVAHSGRVALIAIRRDGPVGVDIEERSAAAPTSIARRFFTTAEAARVAADPTAFFRIWARKEAWAKARGTGLRLPLDEVDVCDDVPGWSIVDLEVAPGYAAAVAWPGPLAPVRISDAPEAAP